MSSIFTLNQNSNEKTQNTALNLNIKSLNLSKQYHTQYLYPCKEIRRDLIRTTYVSIYEDKLIFIQGIDQYIYLSACLKSLKKEGEKIK